MHGVLEVTFNQDPSRIRRDNAAENVSRLRRMVLNKLGAYEDPGGKKPSVRMNRKTCGWSFEYVLKLDFCRFFGLFHECGFQTNRTPPHIRGLSQSGESESSPICSPYPKRRTRPSGPSL